MDKNICVAGSLLHACAATFLAATAMGAQPGAPDENSCKVVFDSMTRQTQTPNHQYFVRSSHGTQPESSEIINTGTERYLLQNGRWQPMPESPAALLKRQREDQRNSKATCSRLRDENVEGVDARVYSEHSEGDAENSDGLVWIAAGSGLPVREQIDTDSGNAKAPKIHIEIRAVYTKIRAPAIAN